MIASALLPQLMTMTTTAPPGIGQYDGDDVNNICFFVNPFKSKWLFLTPMPPPALQWS